MAEDVKPKQGWASTASSKKWHYFRHGRSLCGNFGEFPGLTGALQDSDDNHSANCSACKKKKNRNNG